MIGNEDPANDINLSGAVFTITKGSTTLTSAPTDSDGLTSFTGLEWGTWTVTETVAPVGYDITMSHLMSPLMQHRETLATGSMTHERLLLGR